jgi:hypothetical protein
MGKPKDKLGRGVYQFSNISRQVGKSSGKIAKRKKGTTIGKIAGGISRVANRAYKISRRFK